MSKLKNLVLWIAAITFDLGVLYSAMTHEPVEGEPSQAWFMFAASIGLGLFKSYREYEAQQNQADQIEEQAEQQRKEAAAQIERDQQAEAIKVESKREENRQRRAMIENAFSASGMILDGSVSDTIVNQRETDELNTQRIHDAGNNQRALDAWRANENYKNSIYQADSIRGASNIGLGGNLLSTGLGAVSAVDKFGINGKHQGFISGGKASTANQQKSNWFKL